MEPTKNFDTYFLIRNGERIWVRSCHLDLLSPTSPAYCAFANKNKIKITLSGMVFRCDRLSSFFYGDGGMDLRAPDPVPPDLSEVIIEVWHTNDRKLYTFEHSFRLYNVVPSNIRHQECSCCCGGDVDLTFDKIEIVEANKRQIDLMEENSWLKPEYLNESNESNESKVILNEE